MIEKAEVTESLVYGKALLVGLTHSDSLPHSVILSDFCQGQYVNHKCRLCDYRMCNA